MTSSSHKIEDLAGPERRRRWSPAEKLALVRETYEVDATVSLVALRHGIAPNQLVGWRRLAAQGAWTATAAEEEVVPASNIESLRRDASGQPVECRWSLPPPRRGQFRPASCDQQRAKRRCQGLPRWRTVPPQSWRRAETRNV